MRLSKPSDGRSPRERREILRALPWWIRAVGSGAFTGFSPVAPGTAGSLLALALYWFVPGLSEWPALAAASLVALLAGSIAAEKIAGALGHDPSVVVIDEIAGMWIALIALPKGLIPALAAFLLFRFFDIVKPPPASWFDRRPGGFSIMMDDVAAGIYTNICLRILLAAFPLR